LLLLPLALVLAGLAGLVVFRLLTRRLRALEDLASRVSEGDLEVRIADLGRDEIGRLGKRLNEMTENLSRARRLVAESDRQRRRLLADISHELATPLTSIHGYADTLLNPEVPVSDEEGKRYLEGVREESERMKILIDDLLELSRLESGSIPLHRERLDWASLCRNLVSRYRERYSSAGLELSMVGAGSGEKELWVEADGRRLEQVVENLLLNGLRYVPAGGRVELDLQARPAGSITLTVSDDGPGFAEKDLPHVFDRFYRADSARSSEGSGLGLAIVREIILQHGGRTAARNLTEGGAVIEVALPVSRPSH
jgi:signal transduction histidine kinase